MPNKKKKSEPPKDNRSPFHERLKGFDIRINRFGEMESSFQIDKLNEFLNDQVEDKKIGKKDPGGEEE